MITRCVVSLYNGIKVLSLQWRCSSALGRAKTWQLHCNFNVTLNWYRMSRNLVDSISNEKRKSDKCLTLFTIWYIPVLFLNTEPTNAFIYLGRSFSILGIIQIPVLTDFHPSKQITCCQIWAVRPQMTRNRHFRKQYFLWSETLSTLQDFFQ